MQSPGWVWTGTEAPGWIDTAIKTICLESSPEIGLIWIALEVNAGAAVV